MMLVVYTCAELGKHKKEAVRCISCEHFWGVCYGEVAVQVLQSNCALVPNVGLSTLPRVLSPEYDHYLSIPKWLVLKNDVLLLHVQAYNSCQAKKKDSVNL